MKQVKLDGQEDSVRQFILALAQEPDGSVLELHGQAVACLLPVPRADGNGAAEEEWTEEKNARRCALIDREIAGVLTPEEAKELYGLQQAMLRYRRRVAPLPF
jgi:hypothetical protein